MRACASPSAARLGGRPPLPQASQAIARCNKNNEIQWIHGPSRAATPAPATAGRADHTTSCPFIDRGPFAVCRGPRHPHDVRDRATWQRLFWGHFLVEERLARSARKRPDNRPNLLILLQHVSIAVTGPSPRSADPRTAMMAPGRFDSRGCSTHVPGRFKRPADRSPAPHRPLTIGFP
jgi:hypothetical protein